MVGVGQLFAERELFDQRHRRADHERNGDAIGISDVVNTHQPRRPVLLKAAHSGQFADVGVSPAAGAQYGGAGGDVVQVFRGECSHRRKRASAGV